LSTPPAFILSQDQTLQKEKMHTPSGKRQCSEFELTKRMPSLTIHNANPQKRIGLDPKESHPDKTGTRLFGI
ncbi:hypothetical protein, partial [Microbacterium sp. SCN 69-37]|uniref:hypothetical protein n=1 Tax=Microbacterium sp. SCN 69-37 TaxID=1660115 RepID=UPI0025CE33F8